MSKFDPDSEESPKQATEKSHDSLHGGVWKLEGEKSGRKRYDNGVEELSRIWMLGKPPLKKSA